MRKALVVVGTVALVGAALGGCAPGGEPVRPGQGTTSPAPGPALPTRGPVVEEKPVLYLYPERVVSLGVGLSFDGVVSDSYPVAVGGVGADGRSLASWSVTAGPDGVLRDAGGRVYPYLFWEGPTRADLSQGSGFVVARDDVVGFLEEKLALLGLDEREAADFITYWGPRMRANEYTLVSFDPGAYRDAARYTFTADDGSVVEPDTFIRVFMTISAASSSAVVPEQVLDPAPARTGFTAVEWGGAEL